MTTSPQPNQPTVPPAPEAPAQTRLAGKLHAALPGDLRRIMLIQPLQVEETKIEAEIARRSRYYNYPPYGLGLLARRLKAHGFTVDLVDLNHQVFRAIHDDQDADWTPEAIERHWEDCLRRALDETRPDLVGITCMFTMTHPVMLRIAKFVKSLQPEVPVIAGGVHVTNAAEMVLRDGPDIDFVSLYEGDDSFLSLIDVARGRKDESALAQIGALIDGDFIAVDGARPAPPEALDTIPDYQDLTVGDYSGLGEIGTFRFWRPAAAKSAPVLANRGCRAACTFCSVRNFNGPGVRGRTIASVLDEIRALHGEHGITHFTWLDDDLFFDVGRTLELFNGIAGLPFKVTWDASNGVIASAATAHPDLVGAAAASGCIGMYFGIESGNSEILRAVKKPSGIKHYLKIGELMAAHPQIFTRGFLIVGFPNETIAQIMDTVELAKSMNLDWYTVQLLTPLPNTAIHQEMIDLGLIEPESLNTDGDGFTMFSVREGERQRRRERAEIEDQDAFYDLFDAPGAHVPTKAQLNDIWLRADYEINYGRLLDIDDPAKLRKIGRFLAEIADRITVGHPLASHHLAHIERELGAPEAARARAQETATLLAASPYWQSRFEKLGLGSAA